MRFALRIATAFGFALVGGLVQNGLHAATPVVGGGFTAAGLNGEYYANTTLTGQPAFSRHDVRIRFDWREGAGFAGLPVGGAMSDALKNFPKDEFSVKWTGQIRPRYTETYTFHLTGEDGLRFRIRPAGGTWSTLVDSLNASAVVDRTQPLTADQLYDIEFSYVDRANTGASRAIFEWSSPSTPREVVDPIAIGQIANTLGRTFDYGARYADLIFSSGEWRTAAGNTGSDVQADANGWPQVAKCQLEIANSGYYNGTYRFRFKGKAVVKLIAYNSAITTGAVFTVNGTNYTGTLPKGIGYDGTYTTATVALTTGPGNLQFGIDQAERNDGTAGITDLQFMAPIAQNSTTPHEFGELAARESRATFNHFVMERHQGPGLGHKAEYTWANRRPATHRRLTDPEFQIIQCNEQGHDLYFDFPVSWDESAMIAFAKTIRYGSDGVNPYDGYVANPVFPPLNPNLRVYTEHANELPWAVYPDWIWQELHDKAVANHPDWQIVNYDGAAINNGKTLGNDLSDGALSTAGMFRYHALRMKQMSDALRTVYTDVSGAFGEIFRPLAFGQYEQPHLNTMLQFLDNYFNNADNRTTNRYPNPVAPRSYLWGGGGAIYYGTANKFGRMPVDPVQNSGFQSPVLNAGEARLRPTDATWTFTGNAGLASVQLPRASLTLNSLGGNAATPATNVYAGFKFTVGAQDIYVYQLGRMRHSGNGSSHALDVFDSTGNKIVASANESFDTVIDFSKGGTVGAINYVWTRVVTAGGNGYVRSITPMRLLAGKTYYFVSREATPTGANPTPDTFTDATTSVTAPAGITINAAVIGTDGKVWTETPGSFTYGPIDMVFTTQVLSTVDGPVGVPADLSASPNPQTEKNFGTLFPSETQCAFISGTGSIKQTITVAEAGNYWVTWTMARDIARTTGATVRLKIDGLERFNRAPAYRSAWWYHSSQVVSLTAGTHEIAFEGTAVGDTVYIDEVRLGRDTEFFGGATASNFPSGGGAYGQDPASGYYKTAQAECDMAHHWGLVPCTYEGGWAVQGDFDWFGMAAWDDLRYGSPLINAELTKRALLNALSVWTGYGGYVYAYYYRIQANIADTNAPLLKGVQEMNDTYTMNVNTGVAVPAILDCTQQHYEGGISYRGPTYGDASLNNNPNMVPREWKNWVVTVNTPGLYRVTLAATGGLGRLSVNDLALASGPASSGLTGTVFLTKGAHGIKVRAEEALTVTRIIVESAAAPAAQVSGNGLSIGDGDTTPDLADGTSYGVILRNTTLDRTFVVKNPGSQPLTPTVSLVGANAGAFSIVTNLPATLAGGAQANLVIRYAPTSVSSAAATVRITHNGLAATHEFAIAGSAENAPVANAGPDQTTTDRPGVVTLDGTASTGYGLTPAWTQLSGPSVTLTGASTLTPTFPAGTFGTYVFQLTASSPLGNSTDTVTVRITAGDVPAQVFADHDRSVAPGTSVTLAGSAVDVEGDAITYAWTQLSGPSATLSGANTATASFTPSTAGTYVFQLTVTSNGATSTDTVTITVGSPASVLWWGGGTATPTASIATNSANSGFNTVMAGTWGTVTNWNSALDVATGYQAWNSANVAGFKSSYVGGGSPDVALAVDQSAAGLRVELPAGSLNQAYEFISADATNRTLTLAADAQVVLVSDSGSNSVNFRRSGYVTGKGAAILGGSGPVTFAVLGLDGKPTANGAITIESASLSGPVRLTSGQLYLGSTGTGATGMAGSPLVEVLGNYAALRPQYAADADNRLGDTAALVIAHGTVILAAASDTVTPAETIGSLTFEGSGLLNTSLGRTGSTKTGTLTLASGLTRGDNGHGVLVTSHATTSGTYLGGLGVTGGNGVILAGHGLGANAFLPWGFNYGRAQTTAGGQTSTTSAAFLGTDAAGKLCALPASAGSADLAATSWQGFTGAQDVTLDNVTLANALVGNVQVRNLAATVAASGTFNLGSYTLTTQALGFGDNAGRNLTLAGTGALTSPNGKLYLAHRRQNALSNSNLNLNVPVTGALDLIFGGPNGQFTTNADNTHTGVTYVNAGRVNLGASGKLSASREINLSEGSVFATSSADYSVGATTAQTVSGGGTWVVNQRTLTLGAQATLAPGDAGANDTLSFILTTGKLAFAAGSTVALDLGAPAESDAIAFTTAGDWLAGSGNAKLVLTLGAGFDYTKSYVVFRNVTTNGFAFASISGYDTNRYVAYASRAGNDILLTFSKVPNLKPVITTSSLPAANAGSAYSQTLQADNLDYGTTLAWSQTAGTVPLGLSLGANGVVSGTPAAGTQGSYGFTARVADSDGDTGSQTITLVVNGPAGSTSLPADRFAYVDDLGAGIIGEGATLANGQLQVAANGLGLDGAAAGADSALYAEKSVTGNFRATVKIAALSGPAGSRAGLMLRAGGSTPDAGARFVALGSGTGTGYVFRSRATANAAATAETTVQVGGVARADAFAKWVRLQRTGDTIALSVSADGVTFSPVDGGSLTLASLGSSVQIGLYAASGTLAETADARFESYEIKLQDPDLVLHYTFDEGAGTSIGDSATGGNNHGTTVTGALWTGSGKYGAAYGTSVGTPGFPSFFPANQNDLNFDPRSQAFTITLWAKITGGSTYQTLFSKSSSTARQFQVWTGANNSSLVGYSASTSSTFTFSPVSLSDGNWHLVTFVNYNDAGTWKSRIYLDNGSSYWTYNVGSAAPVTQSLRIGEVSTNYNRMLGFIDDFRIYKRALTASEVSQLFNGQLP